MLADVVTVIGQEDDDCPVRDARLELVNAAGFVVAQAIAGAPVAAPSVPQVPASAAATAPDTQAESSERVDSAPAAEQAVAEVAAIPARRASAPRAAESRRNERLAADGAGSASALKADLTAPAANVRAAPPR